MVGSISCLSQKMGVLSSNSDCWEDLKNSFFQKGPGPTSGKSEL